MNAKILLSVIMATILLLVPSAFAQRAGQDPTSSQVSVAKPIADLFTEALIGVAEN
jgi:hypothetical protein